MPDAGESTPIHGTRRATAVTDGKNHHRDCIVTPLVDGGQETTLLVELTQVDRLMRLARDENAGRRAPIAR
jgi:hypothetical protein